MKIVRLGQDVDRTGRLAPEALERTFAACREYASVVREFGVPPERVRFVATSASRDADNREEFVRGVVDILGVEPEVITGDQEAEFSFTGATKELSPGDFAPPYLVVDLGGGSTEFVLGAEEVEAARSVDIGCVRLTERHFVEDGAIIATPDRARTEALRADVEAALDEVERAVPLARARTLVGLAGTVTTLGALALELETYDPARTHHTRVSLTQVRDLTTRLVSATHDERAALPAMHEGRVDVISSRRAGPPRRHGTHRRPGGGRERTRHPRRHRFQLRLSGALSLSRKNEGAPGGSSSGALSYVASVGQCTAGTTRRTGQVMAAAGATPFTAGRHPRGPTIGSEATTPETR